MEVRRRNDEEPPPLPAVEEDTPAWNRPLTAVVVLGGGLSFLLCCGVLSRAVGPAGDAAGGDRFSENGVEPVADVGPETFADVDYSFEFDEQLYQSVPAGTTLTTEAKQVREIPDGREEPSGGWSETPLYRAADGELKAHGRQRYWESDRKERLLYERWFLDGEFHGPSTEWNRSGEEIATQTNVRGNPHGIKWRRFDHGGKVESQWLHGVRHGYHRQIWSNGSLASEKWFIHGEQRGTYVENFESGKPARREVLDENGKAHGVQLVWGSEKHVEPHRLPYRHGLLHGELTRRRPDGAIIQQCVYEDGELVTPMHQAGQSTAEEVLWCLSEVSGVGWYGESDRPQFTGGFEQTTLRELLAPPAMEEEYTSTTAVVAYSCSNGTLYFRRRRMPGGEEFFLDLLTSVTADDLLRRPDSQQLIRCDLYRIARGVAPVTDRHAIGAQRRLNE